MYNCKTTFWEDFTIAELFGVYAVKDTYYRAFKEWKTDVVYLTELVMVLNWKLFFWYDRDNSEYANLYDDLWRKTDQYCMKHLKGRDLDYYIRTTD